MSDSPKNPGLDGRSRDKDGQIDHKHPTTKIKHLREHYGKHFAPTGTASVLSANYSRSPSSNRSRNTSSITGIIPRAEALLKRNRNWSRGRCSNPHRLPLPICQRAPHPLHRSKLKVPQPD
jgi:hypothetical protein